MARVAAGWLWPSPSVVVVLAFSQTAFVVVVASFAAPFSEALPLLAYCIALVALLRLAWFPSLSLSLSSVAVKALLPRPTIEPFTFLQGERRYGASPRCLRQRCQG